MINPWLDEVKTKKSLGKYERGRLFYNVADLGKNWIVEFSHYIWNMEEMNMNRLRDMSS